MTRELMKKFRDNALEVVERGAAAIFEWPDHIIGWQLDGVKELKDESNLKEVRFHGCCVGPRVPGNPKHILKPWKFLTNLEEIREAFATKKCSQHMNHEHIKCEGKLTSFSASKRKRNICYMSH